MTSGNGDLDRVIDDVAREMTDGDAGANLRARVLADIESPRPFAWRPAFALVAVAAAVLIAVVLRPRGGVAPDVPGPSPKVPELSVKAPAPSNVPEPSPKVPAIAKVRESVSASNPFSETPLNEDPLVMEPIGADPIALEQLPSIAPIAVTPLDAQGESQ